MSNLHERFLPLPTLASHADMSKSAKKTLKEFAATFEGLNVRRGEFNQQMADIESASITTDTTDMEGESGNAYRRLLADELLERQKLADFAADYRKECAAVASKADAALQAAKDKLIKAQLELGYAGVCDVYGKPIGAAGYLPHESILVHPVVRAATEQLRQAKAIGGTHQHFVQNNDAITAITHRLHTMRRRATRAAMLAT